MELLDRQLLPCSRPRERQESSTATYLHFSASISLPGVSRHRRMRTVCCLTTVKASSSSRAWSSTPGGDAMWSSSLPVLVMQAIRRGDAGLLHDVGVDLYAERARCCFAVCIITLT